jgi:heme-degrading monooxygenase HmoA
MQHLRLATYEIKKGTFQDVAKAAENGMLRTFREQPGFVRYGVADVGDKTLVSISLWETRKHADAAVPVAATWVRENLGDQIEIRSNQIGDFAFFEGAPATV